MSLTTKIIGFYNRLPEKVRTVIWSAGRAFVGAVIILVPGVLAAPSFTTEKALVIAALIAGGTAAVRVIQHAVQSAVGK